ncbi:NAD(P)H-dependent FMN reductase [Actinokineospora baliensis]|uniref:NADPH-dependent FMN reductase n=1 Tax=Actinokineospora baliensis TaxID=547056 RepID=UPI001959B2A7|nr:NAD(P)H-dependent oxidoreductase [Actinokineospora baliensis]MBM7775584.1 NAD(P)H-dependent FMN reductase [Actinokineospora baliensis]
MSTPVSRVAVIIGSVRKGRFGPTAAKWFAERAAAHDDVELDIIDLVDFDLPTVLTDTPAQDVKAKLGELDTRLTAADAFVVITPEYNHSYPASLKAFIDWHFTHWRAKPIGLISYGGQAGGLRAVEHLRQVFAELHAVTIRDSISFYNYPDQFNADGTLKDPAAAEAAAKTLLDQLTWWSLALGEARAKRPYTA